MQTQSRLSAEDISRISLRCVEIINGHQHREAIREGDVRHWVREVVGDHGELAIWHAIRAGGFGGSEIGVLVRNHEGFRADHQASAHDIVEGKLLRRVPDQETGPMRRGHDNEPRHAEWFYEKYAAHRDVEAFNTLKDSVGLEPWMRYSPDEVALVPTQEPNPALGGRRFARWLADYKAPSKVEDSDEIHFQYACQLHQGALICSKAGIHLDGLVLSQFDWASWKLKDDHVPYDPELSRKLLRAGNHYWDYVLRGEVPPYINRPRFDKEAELREEWETTANRIAQLNAMSKAINDRLDAEAATLREHLAQFRMAGTKMTLGELNISVVAKVDNEAIRDAIPDEKYDEIAAMLAKKGGSPSYDAELMAKHLRSSGVSLKQFAKPRFDDDKVYEYARSNDLDADAFIKEEIRLSASPALQEQARETVQAVYAMPVRADAASHEASPEDMHASDVAQADQKSSAKDTQNTPPPTSEKPRAGAASGAAWAPDDRDGTATDAERNAPRSVSA